MITAPVSRPAMAASRASCGNASTSASLRRKKSSETVRDSFSRASRRSEVRELGRDDKGVTLLDIPG